MGKQVYVTSKHRLNNSFKPTAHRGFGHVPGLRYISPPPRCEAALTQALGLYMRFSLAIVFITTLVSCSQAPLRPSSDKIVGLWQFPERQVWLQINADGTTYQCRVASSETTFTSRGRFITPSSISWERNWGVDEISVDSGSIVLHGKWGDFTYIRATSPLNNVCSTSDEP